jgi:hypothetical protein
MRGTPINTIPPISDDPTHFELLDANLMKDGVHVYWSDGRVLSDDPAHFVIVSDVDYYTFTKHGRTVHVNGNPIAGADPATFRVLGGAYARDAREVYYFTDWIPDGERASFEVLDGSFARDAKHAYWMGKAIPGADPKSFPAGKAATGCSTTSITFAE